jgi:hypothetical protein
MLTATGRFRLANKMHKHPNLSFDVFNIYPAQPHRIAAPHIKFSIFL